MATNPMQRKARNSFLLGVLVTLLLAGIVIALLFMQLINEKKNEEEKVKVYTLSQDVSSGQVITTDMLVMKSVDKSLVPSNAANNIDSIQNYSLQDKAGNEVYTKTNNNESQLYIQIDGTEYQLNQEEETENYYINKRNDKEYIELDNVPLVAKVTMKKNTVITAELVNKADNVIQKDVRKQEYNMLVLPMDLDTGDYVDIRLLLPSGQDYIVVSKKEVTIPDVGGVPSEDTIWVNMTEDEILHMSCAIIDSYQIAGSKLYVTKYTEAGMQEAATPTYPANQNTTALLQSDPNILDKAMNAIRERYGNTNGATLRNEYINSVINNQGDQAKTNIETNMTESVTNSKNSRKEYLDSLSGAVQ